MPKQNNDAQEYQDYKDYQDYAAYQKSQPTKQEEPSMLESIGRGAVRGLPAVGTAVGGALGSPLGPFGIVGGAAAGGIAGKGAQNLIEGLQSQGLDYFTGKPTAEGTLNALKETTSQGLESAGQETGGRLVSGLLAKGVGALRTGYKPLAPAISEAAERLGVKTTPGMLTSSPTVQGLESSLEQSPSLAGRSMREITNPPREQLAQQARSLVEQAPVSKYQSGVEGIKGVSAKLGEKYGNIQMAYEPFNKELPKMLPGMEDRFKLADQIAQSTKGTLSLNANLEGFGEKVSNKIMVAKSLDDLEKVRKQVSKSLTTAYKSGDANAVEALSKVEDSLSDFRDEQFVKLAKESYPGKGGKNLGEKMVDEYKNARDTYKRAMDDLKEIGPLFGIRNKNPKAFVEAIQNISPEQMNKKLFNTNNFDAIQKVEKYFPDEFRIVKQSKLQEIFDKSMDPQGEFSAKKMLNVTKKITPEIKRVLFGSKLQTLDDVETIAQNFPKMIGPSGTPQGESIKSMLNPILQATELGRLGAYKLGTNPEAQQLLNKTGDFLARPTTGSATGLLLNQTKNGLMRR